MNKREAKIKKTLDEDGDRISALPDGILCHILSFLPTTQAATTTILSTRWKYLFASLPNIGLDDWFPFRPRDHIIDAQCSVDFVYRLLLVRKTPHIDRFRLTCYKRYDNSHLNAWIRSVVWRNVKELDICMCAQDFGMFPSIDIFTCKTLVNLRLDGECILQVPILVCLPNVKVLHLAYLKFDDDDTIRRIFSGCPLLEELELFYCRLESVQTLDISSPSLKSLEFHGFDGYDGDYQIVLNAPVLEYLEVSGFVAGGYLVNDLKSMFNSLSCPKCFVQRFCKKNILQCKIVHPKYGDYVLVELQDVENYNSSFSKSNDAIRFESFSPRCMEIIYFLLSSYITGAGRFINSHVIGLHTMTGLYSPKTKIRAILFRQTTQSIARIHHIEFMIFGPQYDHQFLIAQWDLLTWYQASFLWGRSLI